MTKESTNDHASHYRLDVIGGFSVLDRSGWPYPEEGSIVRKIGKGPDSVLYYLDHYFSEDRDVIKRADGNEMVQNGMYSWDRKDGSGSEEDIAFVKAVTLHEGEHWFVPETIDKWSAMGEMDRNSLEVVKPKGPRPKTLDEKTCKRIQKESID